MTSRIFLLSPASCRGWRARLVMAPGSRLALAEQLRSHDLKEDERGGARIPAGPGV